VLKTQKNAIAFVREHKLKGKNTHNTAAGRTTVTSLIKFQVHKFMKMCQNRFAHVAMNRASGTSSTYGSPLPGKTVNITSLVVHVFILLYFFFGDGNRMRFFPEILAGKKEEKCRRDL
jgi:hypothetical protein